MQKAGTLFIIAAPSGAGKTSLVKELVKLMPNLVVSISHTTREQRVGEQDGIDYHFVDQQRFEKMVAEDEFIEHATVFGNYYGTSRAWVEEQLQAGKDVVLEIDWQGATQVKRRYVNCINIFILPPSKAELMTRLRARAQDDPEVINQRMALASQEISHYREFDYLVINDDFATAVADIETIIHAQNLLQTSQQCRQAKLLAELLA